MKYHVTYSEEAEHAEKLKRGLARLGPGFLAFICWSCAGTGTRNFQCCDVCGRGKPYGMSLGLLQGYSQPAPESVVNQVIIAGETPCA